MNLVSHILLYIISWMDFPMQFEAVLERLIQRKKALSREDISLTYFKELVKPTSKWIPRKVGKEYSTTREALSEF